MSDFLFYAVLVLAAAAALLAVLVALRTMSIKKAKIRQVKDRIPEDETIRRVSESLSQMIRFRTTPQGTGNGQENGELLDLHEYLENRYPRVHEIMQKEVVGSYSLLYHWKAGNPSAKPVLFCAHLDVVPAGGEWEKEPFSGEIAQGCVFGRGALDGKNTVACLLEAAEILCREGYVPDRDIYFAFGHDEQTGGQEGAAAMANLLHRRGIQADMVLDEGLPISKLGLKMEQEAAFLGVAEKGFMRLRLTAGASGGHTGFPPRNTALGVLSEAVCRLEYRHPKPRLSPVTEKMLRTLAPLMPLRQRIMIANLWLLKPVLLRGLSKYPVVNAMLHTTAVTVDAGNDGTGFVLPRRAEILSEIRTVDGNSCDEMADYVRKLIADLPMETRVLEQNEASGVSYCQGSPYQTVIQSIHRVFGPIRTAPCILPDRSDARWYTPLSGCIIRFSPFIMTSTELGRVRSENECIKQSSLGQGVLFYTDLIKSLQG